MNISQWENGKKVENPNTFEAIRDTYGGSFGGGNKPDPGTVIGTPKASGKPYPPRPTEMPYGGGGGVMPPRENPGFTPFPSSGNKPVTRPINMDGPGSGNQPSGGQYGGRIGQKPGTMNTMDFKDSDGDGTDDRNQRKAGGKNIVARRREKSLADRKAEKAEKGTTRDRDERKQKAVNLRESYKGAVIDKQKKKKKY